MLKKLTVPFFLQAGAFLFALVGIIVTAVSNATERYPLPGASLVFLFAILGAVLVCASTLLTFKFENSHLLVFLSRLASIVFLAVALCLVIINRVEIAGTFSYDRENQAAVYAFASSMVAVGFLLVSDLVLIVSSFFTTKKQA